MSEKNQIMEMLKIGRLNQYFTNCYVMDILNSPGKLLCVEDSFIFLYEDHGIKRAVFSARNEAVFQELINFPHEEKFYIEYMTKDPRDALFAGMEPIAKMMRLANPDCNSVFNNEDLLKYRDDSLICAADVDDTHEINALLWSTFNTEISHLLYDNELCELIKNGQIFIHRSEVIDALLQVYVKPRKFYINQVINKGEKKVIHAMLLQQLYNYCCNGGKYLYAWVEEKNIASIKFHGKYGMEHDGMWSLLYCIK